MNCSDIADHVSRKITEMGSFGKILYPAIHASYKFSHLVNVTPALLPEDYMGRCKLTHTFNQKIQIVPLKLMSKNIVFFLLKSRAF